MTQSNFVSSRPPLAQAAAYPIGRLHQPQPPERPLTQTAAHAVRCRRGMRRPRRAICRSPQGCQKVAAGKSAAGGRRPRMTETHGRPDPEKVEQTGIEINAYDDRPSFTMQLVRSRPGGVRKTRRDCINNENRNAPKGVERPNLADHDRLFRHEILCATRLGRCARRTRPPRTTTDDLFQANARLRQGEHVPMPGRFPTRERPEPCLPRLPSESSDSFHPKPAALGSRLQPRRSPVTSRIAPE